MNTKSPCHLCITHSPLVTRVFEAAMRQQDIPADAVRSIARRGAPVSGEGLRIDAIADEMEQRYRKCDRRGFRTVWKRFDEALRGLTGGRPFEAYVPHLNKIIYQEIVLHPDCSGYSFLEEGFTSMAWSGRRNNRSAWMKILRCHVRSFRVGARYRFTRLMFDHSLPHFRAAYAISDQAFRGMPGRICVAPHLPPLPAGEAPGNTYIILDAIYLFKGVRWEDYEDALIEELRTLQPAPGEVLVKFHFADAAFREKFESLRVRLEAEGIANARLLDPDFAVEHCLTSMDLLLFAVTALGYYSALSGVRVRCFACRIKDFSLPSLIKGGTLPEDFKRVSGLEVA